LALGVAQDQFLADEARLADPKDLSANSICRMAFVGGEWKKRNCPACVERAGIAGGVGHAGDTVAKGLLLEADFCEETDLR